MIPEEDNKYVVVKATSTFNLTFIVKKSDYDSSDFDINAIDDIDQTHVGINVVDEREVTKDEALELLRSASPYFKDKSDEQAINWIREHYGR